MELFVDNNLKKPKLFNRLDLVFSVPKKNKIHFVSKRNQRDYLEVNNPMNQKKIRLCIQPNLLLLIEAKLQFLYHLKKVRFLEIYQHHTHLDMKGLVVFLYLMLFYFLFYVYEQNH